ncbi:hypothetical protein [Roseitranquillus sediminis]|uniref:hypothetical protein n=1 Tax=Roseitranquillus sediminis TaxID=2809051 RepID=UPI001D0C251D|nr:hypothetical protein [Roseitranquillus sediminis]MBM9596175.1 hypothetical protein [Roseitranquillus sediminis]
MVHQKGKDWQDGVKSDEAEFAEEADSLWRITLGPLIWALHFVASYGTTAAWCAKVATAFEPVPGLRIGLAVLTVAALAGIVWVGWRAWRQWDFTEDWDYVNKEGENEDRHEFLGHAAFLLAIVSFVGVVYVAMPVLLIESCR